MVSHLAAAPRVVEAEQPAGERAGHPIAFPGTVTMISAASFPSGVTAASGGEY